jgi:hypothetical protein
VRPLSPPGRERRQHVLTADETRVLYWELALSNELPDSHGGCEGKNEANFHASPAALQ